MQVSEGNNDVLNPCSTRGRGVHVLVGNKIIFCLTNLSSPFSYFPPDASSWYPPNPWREGDIPLKIISGCFSQWKQLLLHRNSLPAAQEFAEGIAQAANGCYFRQGTCGKNSLSLYWNSDELAARQLIPLQEQLLKTQENEAGTAEPAAGQLLQKRKLLYFGRFFP